MQTLPRIIITTDDFQRLNGLLDAVDAHHFEEEQADSFAQLWRELERAEIVEPSALPPDVVSMNSRVRFCVDGEEREMTLCYPKDVNSSGRFVSILAPIGSALIGLRVGQEIDWRLPSGRSKRVRIVSVDYQPERAGELGA